MRAGAGQNFSMDVRTEGMQDEQRLRVELDFGDGLLAFMDWSLHDMTYGCVCPEGERVWRTVEHRGDMCFRMIKSGSIYRTISGGRELYLRGLLGEQRRVFDPQGCEVRLRTPEGVKAEADFSPDMLFAADARQAVSAGAHGRHDSQQIIPGAILHHEGAWYMYGMAGEPGDEEGASRRTVTLSRSEDLEHWTHYPEPVVPLGMLGVAHDNLYPNAVQEMEDGRIALFCSIQRFPHWIGIYLFVADTPEGPFRCLDNKPVFRAENLYHPMHEFDVARVDLPQGKYMMLLASYAPHFGGDRGLQAFSDDLIQWRTPETEYVFFPETVDGWDCEHIRPRSLTKVGGTWYMWYEGVQYYSPPPARESDGGHHGASVNALYIDTVGLAWTRDFVHWHYHARNPLLAPRGIAATHFDSVWTGWPRMVVRGENCYLFYSAAGKTVSVGLRVFPLAELLEATRGEDR